jgi:hypothetical protein
MTQETAPHVAAIYDWGRWTVQCPVCGNGLKVAPSQPALICQWANGRGEIEGCGATIAVDWPANPGQIVAELATLPEARRHWEPAPDPLQSDDPATVAAAGQYAEAGLTPTEVVAELAAPVDEKRSWSTEDEEGNVVRGDL